MNEQVPFLLTSAANLRYIAHQLIAQSPYPNHGYRVRNFGPDSVKVSRNGAAAGDPVVIPAGGATDCFLQGTQSITVELNSGASNAAGTWERIGYSYEPQ